jgi:hypothetical protein
MPLAIDTFPSLLLSVRRELKAHHFPQNSFPDGKKLISFRIGQAWLGTNALALSRE